ncbi:MAG: hypothetical protein ACXVAX_02600 [Pseudobdellovibrio sp.]
MKNIGLFLSLFLALNQANAAPSCRDLVNSINKSDSAQSLSGRPQLISENYIEKFDLAAQVKNADGDVVGSSLKQALSKTAVKNLLSDRANHPREILLRARLPESKGGGELRLITLDFSKQNLEFNYLELMTLLKVNPELANELGMYRVEAYDDVAWVPDVTALNYRLKNLVKKFGYADVKWNYAPADGVISTEPYVKMLANGQFPYAMDNNVNILIHDSMHAVAFAVLNITPGGRKVLDVGRIRNQIILKIYDKLSVLENKNYAHDFLETYSKLLSTDALERSMLLTILLTGNYDYFSTYNSFQNNADHRPYNLQNKEVTVKRIYELLKLYNNAQMTFATALDRLAPESDPNRQLIKNIFLSEIGALKSVNEEDLRKASQQIVKFIPQFILLNPSADGPTRASGVLNETPAGPETLSAH